MVNTGLAFLMNLTGIAGNPGDADTSGLLPSEPEPSGVKAFLTFYDSLTNGEVSEPAGAFPEFDDKLDKDVFARLGAAESHFEGFDGEIAESLFVTPETDSAVKIPVENVPVTDTNLAAQSFDPERRVVGAAGEEIRRIDRLDTPARTDHHRRSVGPERHNDALIGTSELPALSSEGRVLVDDNKIRESLPLIDEHIDPERPETSRLYDIVKIDRNAFTAIPADQDQPLIVGDAQIAGKVQTEPPLSTELKPAPYQFLTPYKPKPFDVAAFAASPPARPRDTSELVDTIGVRQRDRNVVSAHGIQNAAAAAAPDTGVAAAAVRPVIAERIAADEIPIVPVIDTGAVATANAAGDRAPVQFAPPTATALAGAAWAQVISAISERSGEAKLELRLNPPELGRVVIGFESDGAELVRAVVSADSQQTLDLMRRNLDILQRELARSGLDNINVELADRDARSQSHNTSERTLAFASSEEATSQSTPIIPLASLIADGRLDIRV